MCVWGGYVLVASPPNSPVLGGASVRMCRGIQEEDGWGYLRHDTWHMAHERMALTHMPLLYLI